MTVSKQPDLPVIGWREKVSLPDLNITSVKAKLDTGARSSALHAFDLSFFQRDGIDFVRFKVHPSQRSKKRTITTEAKLLEMRTVRNSGGQAEIRPVIETTVVAGKQQWSIELTLTNRDVMGFRMLLGRQAVRHRFLVDSSQSYLQSSAPTHRRKHHPLKPHESKQPAYEDSHFVEKLLSLFDSPS